MNRLCQRIVLISKILWPKWGSECVADCYVVAVIRIRGDTLHVVLCMFAVIKFRRGARRQLIHDNFLGFGSDLFERDCDNLFSSEEANESY